jgi:signal peptidase II
MRPLVSYSIAWGVFLLDFVTKRIVLANQDSFREGIPLIDGLLRFTYVRNAGAAFGILQGGRWPFVIVSVLAVVGLSWILRRADARSALRSTAYALILGGAAGNLIDRLFYGGKVVDFVEMGWRGHIFPVYNVADMGVSIGATLLVLALMREGESHRSAGGEESPAAPPEEDSATSIHRAEDTGSGTSSRNS